MCLILKFHSNYKIDEKISKNLIHENVLPTDPTKKVRLIIYNKKFKTSKLIISNNIPPSTELLDRTNVVYLFKCPRGDCVCIENSAYVGLTTTTLSRRLTMHLNESSSIAFHFKNHSIPKSKFQKILVENTTIIVYEIDKHRQSRNWCIRSKTSGYRLDRGRVEFGANVTLTGSRWMSNNDITRCDRKFR